MRSNSLKRYVSLKDGPTNPLPAINTNHQVTPSQLDKYDTGSVTKSPKSQQLIPGQVQNTTFDLQENVFYMKTILAHDMVKREKKHKIHWEKITLREATWERESNITQGLSRRCMTLKSKKMVSDLLFYFVYFPVT